MPELGPLESYTRPVVFFANGLGDTILALPAIRAVAKLFPQRLSLVCDKGVHSALLSDLPFDRVVETRMERNVPDWTREFAAADVKRKLTGCDFFISLVPWHSRSLERLLEHLEPRSSIGFFDAFRIMVPLNFRQHASDLAFDVPRALDASLRLEDYAAPLRSSPADRAVALGIRESIPPRRRIMVVHADTGPNKMWPSGRFVKVLNAFLDQRPEFLALLVGTTRQTLDVGQNASRIIPCYGVPFGVTISLVAASDIFLGVDSSVLHIADLCRVPSVGLFGASSVVEFGFRFSTASVVCDGRTMASIRTAAVLRALHRVVDRSDGRGRAL